MISSYPSTQQSIPEDSNLHDLHGLEIEMVYSHTSAHGQRNITIPSCIHDLCLKNMECFEIALPFTCV